MRDVPRSQQSIAWPENKSPLSDGDLEFSGKNKVHLILAHMRVTGYGHPRSETNLQQAVGSSRIYAR
jgi:hypothetical protein